MLVPASENSTVFRGFLARNCPATIKLFISYTCKTLPVNCYFSFDFRGPCIASIFLFIYFQHDATLQSLFISRKLLYMFRVVSPPIIRNTTVFTASGTCQNFTATCHYCGRVTTLPQKRQVAVTVWQVPDAVNTVVCATDDGWRYHPKHVEQFSRNK